MLNDTYRCLRTLGLGCAVTVLLTACVAPRSPVVVNVQPTKAVPVAPPVSPDDPRITYATLPIVTTGVTQPVLVTNAGDARLFIVEQKGKVKIWREGHLLPRPFIDVADRISNGEERGLLGLAFEPNYAQTGRFYLYYTDENGDVTIA